MAGEKSRVDMQDETGIKRKDELPSKSYVQIGTGEIGGKAHGLVQLGLILKNRYDPSLYPGIEVDIPWFWIITSDWFDQFMEKNNLYSVALSKATDQHISNAFQRAELPPALVTELKAVISDVHQPLAVRSSSLLEDSLREPFAGVYATKMIPNNQFSAEARLRTLVEAIKFVYASTFSCEAKSYRQAIKRSDREEKMSVLIQEVVGVRCGDRFYPNVAGVARSYNYYSLGYTKPEDGVVSLALGLGKTIVEGGRSWTYCPAYPKLKPPVGSMSDLLKQTQTRYWSVNMGKPPTYDPIQETEYLFEGNLGHAEDDGLLCNIASTYDPQADRLTIGTSVKGARVLNFAPLLELDEIPLNGLVKYLLSICEQEFNSPVEIEFAVNFDQSAGRTARFGFLQVRPMLVSSDKVLIKEAELHGENVFVASEQVLGNGQTDCLKDIVYVKPDEFSAKDSWLIAAELDVMNRKLLETGRPYLLVVFGRLGSSDPWLGIPVKWGQVSGAKVIVEASSTDMNVDMSQGSHFFHNVTCLRVLYFSTDRTGQYSINWNWLERQQTSQDSKYVRHVTLAQPIHVKVDGKSGRGVISYERAEKISD